MRIETVKGKAVAQTELKKIGSKKKEEEGWGLYVHCLSGGFSIALRPFIFRIK